MDIKLDLMFLLVSVMIVLDLGHATTRTGRR